MYTNCFEFNKAVPVWKKGDSKVINQTIELVCDLSVKSATLRIAGSTIYEVFVNGEPKCKALGHSKKEAEQAAAKATIEKYYNA